jgi:hypothetical protein
MYALASAKLWTTLSLNWPARRAGVGQQTWKRSATNCAKSQILPYWDGTTWPQRFHHKRKALGLLPIHSERLTHIGG